MGWFWATPATPAAETRKPLIDLNSSGCPVQPSLSNQQSSCPVRTTDSPFRPPPSSSSHQPHQEQPPLSEKSTFSRLNPLNYMFSHISQERAPNQTVYLPTEREISSIPRGDSAGNWEYPSPQQMYNALLRKGYTDTPQEAVEEMVAVHNFLNEGAWQEIVVWESTFADGLKSGWEKCRRGSENLAMELEKEKQRGEYLKKAQPQLLRFMGRPQDRSPKASILQVMGWIYPAKFGTPPPFDRHDWYVLRQTPSGPKEVRYVIDFYSGPPEPTGEPVFYLDIRPALDSPTAALERLMMWGSDIWWKASGGAVRNQN
ncbi:hypothetical protein VTO42DRAFT_2575 [Malbranchea cinnamomea]